jgi:hypothetical protein
MRYRLNRQRTQLRMAFEPRPVELDPAQQRNAAIAIDEVIVSAQRREENLPWVPIAITVADAKWLQQARGEGLKNVQAPSSQRQL